MNNQFNKELSSLGYRPMNDVIWGKPFGNSLIVFDYRHNLLSQRFKGADGNLHVWDAATYDADKFENNFKHFISDFEAYGYKSIGHISDVDFSFLTTDEVIKYEMNL